MRLRRVDLRSVSRLTIVLTASLSLVGLWTGVPHPPSAAAGGAVMLANFHLIRMLVSLLMRPGLGPWAPVAALVLLTLKLALAVVLVAGVLYQFPVEPMAFAAGASMLLVSCVLEAAFVGEPIDMSKTDES